MTADLSFSRNPSSTWFLIDADDSSIYHVTPTTRLSFDLSAAILARLASYAADYGAPAGILIDVRRSPLLSLVRLSSLIDMLSQMNVPMAVVLSDDTQQRLAALLHNTVRHRQRVGYFITSDDATLFLDRYRRDPLTNR
jgi:hypothetical protein